MFRHADPGVCHKNNDYTTYLIFNFSATVSEHLMFFGFCLIAKELLFEPYDKMAISQTLVQNKATFFSF